MQTSDSSVLSQAHPPSPPQHPQATVEAAQVEAAPQAPQGPQGPQARQAPQVLLEVHSLHLTTLQYVACCLWHHLSG